MSVDCCYQMQICFGAIEEYQKTHIEGNKTSGTKCRKEIINLIKLGKQMRIDILKEQKEQKKPKELVNDDSGLLDAGTIKEALKIVEVIESKTEPVEVKVEVKVKKKRSKFKRKK